ncbi:RagB/SusD family nutrient uptake outer membrane protein [Pedobacter sp. Du54]|uniref:RagB/SusD family nutrient uptake outer membrane protein n=1 Tax=Pedobacter anseongensis TaxID=3133439 RepID=UPI00309B7906
MKRNIFFVALLSLAYGCQKLDLAPQSQISDPTFWKNPEEFKLAANNFYNSLEQPNIGDNNSDIAFGYSPNPVSNGSYTAPENSATWTSAYAAIRSCNYLLEKAEDYGATSEIQRWIAEARFFRAYNYWLLLRLYGGVPIIDKTLDVNDPEVYTKRSTMEETVKFILADLEAAAVGLPLKNSLSSADIGRVTKGAAYGIKAKVALYAGTWDKFHNNSDSEGFLDTAIIAAKKVMESNQYSLFKGKGNQSYRYLFIEEGNDASETILDRRIRRDVSESDFGWTAGQGSTVPTKKLADLYLSQDGLPISKSPSFQGYSTLTSEFQNRDPRMTMTLTLPGLETVRTQSATTPAPNYPGVNNNRNTNTGYMLYKFSSEDVTGNTIYGKHNFDWHILRLAEIYLIYAEATFEKTGAISDADLDISINLLRERVNMPRLTNVFVTANSLDMRTEIRRERSVELAFENSRYFDLRRWKTAENELPLLIRGVKISGTEWALRPPYSSGLFTTDAQGFLVAESAANRRFDANKHYLQPLPTKEISLYPDILIQNPNW